MFRLFKKRSTSAMDQFIKVMYRDEPPRKSADVAEAVRLAADDLLCGTTDRDRLVSLAKELDAGPIPYSTHELAVSVALRIFKGAGAALREGLFTAQLTARLAALQWAKEGKVVPALLGAFEQTLYKLYKPGVNDQPQREVRAAWRRVRQGAKSYDCQDACDRARRVPSWFESVCDGCIPESSGISNRCEPAIYSREGRPKRVGRSAPLHRASDVTVTR